MKNLDGTMEGKYITPGTAGIARRMYEEKNQMYDLDIVKYNVVAKCSQNQY